MKIGIESGTQASLVTKSADFHPVENLCANVPISRGLTALELLPKPAFFHQFIEQYCFFANSQRRIRNGGQTVDPRHQIDVDDRDH